MVASCRRVSYPRKIIATKNQGFPQQIYNGRPTNGIVCVPVKGVEYFSLQKKQHVALLKSKRKNSGGFRFG